MHRLVQSRFGMFSLSLFFVLVFLASSAPASAATVTVAPTTGVAGQTVIISGSAFDTTSAATITWDGAPLTTVPASVTTSGAGAIPASGNVSFVVPSGAYGAHTVMITTGTTMVGVATFTIGTPSVAVTSPTIPTAGIAPGANLTVVATNMESSSATTFYFDETAVGTVTASRILQSPYTKCIILTGDRFCSKRDIHEPPLGI